MLSIIHHINSSFDCNPTIDARGVFLDIGKTFDKMCHTGFRFKLESYDIGGELINLFKDYLQVRQQRVGLHDHSSSWNVIISGLPQGLALTTFFIFHMP